MRVVSGGILVAIGLLLFYLITTGRLAKALAAYKVLVSGQGQQSTTAQSDATATPSVGSGQQGTAAPLSSLPATVNPFSTPYTPLPALTQPATPTLVH